MLGFRFHTPTLGHTPSAVSPRLCQLVLHLSGSLMPRGLRRFPVCAPHDGPCGASGLGLPLHGWQRAAAWLGLCSGMVPPSPGPLLGDCAWSCMAVGEGVLPSLGGAPLGLWLSFSWVTFSKSLSIFGPLVGKKGGLRGSGPAAHAQRGGQWGPSCWRGGWRGGWLRGSPAPWPPLDGWPPPSLSFSVLSC